MNMQAPKRQVKDNPRKNQEYRTKNKIESEIGHKLEHRGWEKTH